MADPAERQRPQDEARKYAGPDVRARAIAPQSTVVRSTHLFDNGVEFAICSPHVTQAGSSVCHRRRIARVSSPTFVGVV